MQLILSFAASFTVLTVTSPYLAVLVRGLGYGPRMVGLFLGVFEIAGIAGPFLLGWVSEKTGRYRPALALSYLFTLLPIWPLIGVRHPAAALASLIVLAIGVKSIVPVVDTAATVALGSRGNYGLYRSAGSLSFVLLALFFQWQPFLPLSSPVSIAVWLAATTLFAVCFVPALPDRRPADSAAGAQADKSDRPSARSFVDGPFLIGLGMIALSRLSMTPINTFLSLFIVEELQWNAVAVMWALAAVVEIPVMIFSSRLIARFGSPFLLAVASSAVVLRLLLYAVFPNPTGVALGQLLHSLCFGLFHPAAVSFISTRVPPERRATGMAMYLSLGSGLPTFIGSSLGGVVVAEAGYRALFASFSLFAAASVVIYFFNRKTLATPSHSW